MKKITYAGVVNTTDYNTFVDSILEEYERDYNMLP